MRDGYVMFEIKSDPKPKQRPKARIIKKNGRPFVQMYTPKETVEYEELVARTYKEAGLPNFGDAVLKMEVRFIFEPPKSWSKKKKQAAIDSVGKVTKPDTDNLIKALCDGLQKGVAFNDDATIVSITAEKCYGEEGKTIVWLKRLDASPAEWKT